MNLIERIKKHEGLGLKPYRCPAGYLTIGYGRNIEENGITEAEASFLLANDIKNCRAECEKNFRWFNNLDAERQDVLVEMDFNLGIKRFKKFKKMLAACERKDYETASKEMLDSLWARQVGKRAETLAAIMKGDNNA
ncbi:MAG: glycoside hydrolase family protein [Selenomonadaceae bacterium]|nr:glycoside hydrolase family protein [Selenomonadaceae bacterium]